MCDCIAAMIIAVTMEILHNIFGGGERDQEDQSLQMSPNFPVPPNPCYDIIYVPSTVALLLLIRLLLLVILLLYLLFLSLFFITSYLLYIDYFITPADTRTSAYMAYTLSLYSLAS
ncbi:MAG: hypothetical protein EZS28_028983 [Streblomastix strix]|uniref:Uncharacterized protein n=1 Tax=Streblomastix strix TaxID=222440 RepID=A0A5J4V099_9EUKA|nr:MAG: hypothetical protein EZS28_028983 [Streblomastix strix]